MDMEHGWNEPRLDRTAVLKVDNNVCAMISAAHN